MRSAVVLFTRDLRVHDHPALAAAAAESETVVPLFVLDDAVLARSAPRRTGFLGESLRDLSASLDALGSPLVLCRGDPAAETVRVAAQARAEAVFASEDVSAYAQTRERRLRDALWARRIELRVFPGVTVVPPGDLAPSGGDGPFRVFTPYWNRWRAVPRRSVLAAPRSLSRGPAVEAVRQTEVMDALGPRASGSAGLGGERDGRARLERWLADGLPAYAHAADRLATAATSGLSPYLHFGCVSPLEVTERAGTKGGAEAFVRQLCWRDFYHQLHAADPTIERRDLRDRGDEWADDPDAFAAWSEGQTGYPVVDAAMRQLLVEGTMPNRARLIVASFLTKHLYVDWRVGAAHFFRHLVDGDVANNVGNWQWVAGTGVDTRPNRVLNPIRQALRFDPAGDYVRRWIPELAEVESPGVHQPWALGPRRPAAYPGPIVDHAAAVERFRAVRARGPSRGSSGRPRLA